MIILSLVLLGLIIGSFINALVYRLAISDVEIPKKQKHLPKKKLTKKQLSIGEGRSVCTSCGHQLSYRDLIPVVSWVSLGGKCRYCSSEISWQYPAVELLSSILFVVSFIFWPRELDSTSEYVLFSLWLFILSSLIAISLYDIKWMLIPDRVLRFSMVAAVASVILRAVIADDSADVIRSSVIGLLLVGGFFLALYYGSKGRWIGGGDVKLLFFMSIFLGIPEIFVALALGFYGASAIVFPLLLFGKISRKQRIPFGPFLIAGTVVATLFSSQLIDAYKSVFLFG